MATAVKESRETALVLSSPKQLTEFLSRNETARARISPMLRGVDYNTVVGEVYLAASDNPEILKCTPASIVGAVARAVSWGLTIGETVHLVPFNVKVKGRNGQEDAWESRLKAIQDYKGKIELIVAAGAARSINSQCVYENETFEYEQGTHPQIRHIPAISAKQRGALLGAYAVADHGHGRAKSVVYLPIADIDAIRTRHSKQWKQGECPPWYARKTAVNQLAKMLPKNARLMAVLRKFEEDETEIDDPTEPRSVAPAGAGPVAIQDGPAPEPRDPRCICDRETGEQDPNCPIHGDFAADAL